MCHFINCHPSVLQDHAIDSFRVCISNGSGLASGSFPMRNACATILEPLNSQTIRCDMTLFPYCTDILLCISAPGTPSTHKNGSLPSVFFWYKVNAECPCLWHKTHDRNGLSRSHLHHNGRRGVDHVYLVKPKQQYSQLQNMYLLCR
jgi:hypothetical protein